MASKYKTVAVYPAPDVTDVIGQASSKVCNRALRRYADILQHARIPDLPGNGWKELAWVIGQQPADTRKAFVERVTKTYPALGAVLGKLPRSVFWAVVTHVECQGHAEGRTRMA